MQALINESIAQPRFRTWLLGGFSIFALTLARLGIYGVIAYLVTQRYKEIGIRIALGATRQNILQLILARTLKLTAAGILAGLIAAFFLSRFLKPSYRPRSRSFRRLRIENFICAFSQRNSPLQTKRSRVFVACHK
jgi:ABC-type lipoprotein release transport system permease subunit